MIKNILGNLFSFDKMISEQIIKIVYYIGLIAIALGFIGSIYASLTSGFGSFLPMLVTAIVTALLAILLWRVFCECIIIIFRMYARLGDINIALGGTNTERAIPGDAALKEVREAALKAKAAAAERAKTLKESMKKSDVEAELDEVKPAATKKAASVKKTTPVKKTTAAKKTTAKKKTPKS